MSKGQVVTLKYAEPFSNNYLYRGAVDKHNAMHHDVREKLQDGSENSSIIHGW